LASDAQTSFGYVAAGSGWDKSMMSATTGHQTIACIALCEVVDYRNAPVKKRAQSPISVHSGIYVVSDESIVTTRYFFIYPSYSGAFSAVANSLRLPEDIYT